MAKMLLYKGSMKRVKTDTFVEMDEDDFVPEITDRAWRIHRTDVQGCINRYIVSSSIRNFTVLHRLIMSRMLGRELTSQDIVRHKDGNFLNCVRGNLILGGGKVAERHRIEWNGRTQQFDAVLIVDEVPIVIASDKLKFKLRKVFNDAVKEYDGKKILQWVNPEEYGTTLEVVLPKEKPGLSCSSEPLWDAVENYWYIVVDDHGEVMPIPCADYNDALDEIEKIHYLASLQT